MTEANVNRLVSKLAKMRGAALKLGQFMSIQGMLCWFVNSFLLPTTLFDRYPRPPAGGG